MNQYEQFLWDKTGHKYRVQVKKMLLSPYGCAWSYWSRNIILDSGYDTPDTPLQAWQACLLYNAGLAQDREYNFAEILMGIMIITVALQLSSSVFLSMQAVNTIFLAVDRFKHDTTILVAKACRETCRSVCLKSLGPG